MLRAAVCFAYFGGGVWIASRLWIPLMQRTRWRGLSAAERSLRVQHTMHRFCRSFVTCITHVTRMTEVKWVGDEALGAGPLLLVANHPSLIDTPLLLSRLPQADFIVSHDWLRVGLLRPVIDAADYLHAEDGATVVERAVEKLAAGHTVVVYPEGTRSTAEGLRRFQRGAAHIALRSGCDLVPVTIHMTPRALGEGLGWVDYPDEKLRFRIEVGDPIRAVDAGESRPVAARRLTGVLEEHFSKRWERGRS